jgi:hypothetical protein
VGFTLGVLGPSVLARRNNGLYLTQALYHHSNSIEEWHFHPINQKVWQYTVIPTRSSSGGLDALEQSLPLQSLRPQLALEKRASRPKILLEFISYVHARS